MKIKRLVKTAQKMLRKTRVHGLAAARELAWTRARLNLPRNEVFALKDSDPSVRVVTVDPAENFERILPLMPGEIEPHETFVKEFHGQFPASLVAEFSDGRFWGFYGGSVFTANGRLVPELSKDVWGPRLHTAFVRARLSKPTRLSGLTLSLVTPEAAANYHHWTMDLLPRAGLAKRAGYALDAFDHILVKDRGYRFQKEAFERLGLDEKKIIHVDDRLHVQCDRLVVPSVRNDNLLVNRQDMEFSRSLYLDENEVPVKPTRRLYVGRADAAFRRITNNDELLKLLHAHGFEEVAMSKMTVAEQAKIFAEAEIIVGPNGSALANLIFANPKCRVIEFFAPGWVVGYNWMICSNFKLPYTAIVGAGKRPAPGTLPHALKDDITLDLALVEAALENPAG
jgi:capsular polysaccharide biosynthesis protein